MNAQVGLVESNCTSCREELHPQSEGTKDRLCFLYTKLRWHNFIDVKLIKVVRGDRLVLRRTWFFQTFKPPPPRKSFREKERKGVK